MLDAIKPLFLLVLTEKCFEEYFYDFNFFEVNCFKATLSKLLGIGLIAGSLMVKVPQILKIYNGKSGSGLSVPSVLLDLTAITIHGSYNYVKGFPFSSWGDGLMLGIQTLIVFYLILYYSKRFQEAYTFLVAYALIVFVMCTLVPDNILWLFQACNVPVLMSGKLLQAWENYKNGSTGQLSAATVIALTAGSMARIFTSIQETGDSMMIITYLAATSANLVLFIQIFYYWNAVIIPAKKKSKKDVKKDN